MIVCAGHDMFDCVCTMHRHVVYFSIVHVFSASCNVAFLVVSRGSVYNDVTDQTLKTNADGAASSADWRQYALSQHTKSAHTVNTQMQ